MVATLRRQLAEHVHGTLRERRERAEAREKGRKEAFESWAQQKDMVAAALAALAHIEAPKGGGGGGGAGAGRGGAGEEMWLKASRGLSRDGRADKGGRALEAVDTSSSQGVGRALMAVEGRAPAQRVGRALKAVDARLLKEWMDWCTQSAAAGGSGGSSGGGGGGGGDGGADAGGGDGRGRITAAQCQAVWDFLPPVACDTHAAGYSALRETFLKLLRPGVDYRAGFQKVLQRRTRLREGSRGGSEGYNESPRDKDDADPALTKSELRYLLTKELGIVMGAEEMRRLDQHVSWREFEAFTGGTRDALRGDSTKRLEQRCTWETTCPATGMSNAYVVTASRAKLSQPSRRPSSTSVNDDDDHGSGAQRSGSGGRTLIQLSNGETRVRTELPERQRRLDLLARLGLAAPDGGAAKKGTGGAYDEDGFEDGSSDASSGRYESDEFKGRSPSPRARDGGGGGSAPRKHRRCAAVAWTMADRQGGLRTLKRLAKPNQEAEELKKILKEGVPPPPPKLWSVPLGHPHVGDGGDVLVTEMLLRWKPQPGSLVAFFSLEMSGAEGSKAFRQADFTELCRDPPDAEGDTEYEFWVRDLQPNTAYAFRIRGFNGFGAGGYTHAVFATRPSAPPPPVVIRAAPTEVTLRWRFGARYQERLRELRKVFEEADTDGSGDVSREELLALLEGSRSGGPHTGLLAFLKSCFIGGGGAAGVSVFDAIETSDDERLSWQEFLRYFSNAGVFDAKRGGASQSESTATASASAGSSDPSGVRYVVEHCEDEGGPRGGRPGVGGEVWKEAWSGNAGEAVLKGLLPGTQYRFRVVGLNKEGVRGPNGESVVATTLLETPAVLSIAAPKGNGGLKGDQRVAAMLSQWTKAERAEDRGVSVAKAFARYDRDGSGAIDPVELGNLLEDLGVNPTEERLHAAFGEFDLDRDGLISLDEFEAWWRRDEVTYVIKRDEGTCSREVEAGVDIPAQPLKVTSYRGQGTQCEVAGLLPNTLYRLHLRVTTSRSQSALSAPLEVMTAPRTPAPPALVRIEPHAAVLKFYPGLGGACKFSLQSLFVESLDTGSTSSSTAANAQEGWAAAYEGIHDCRQAQEGWAAAYEGIDNCVRINGLQPAAVYRFRVAALNARGGASGWSDPVQICTLAREDCTAWKPALAAEQFPVDCNGDIAVGDTIIFTERLYIDGTEFGSGRLHLSVASSASSMAGGGGEFIGERTVAAHVIKDSYLSMKRRGSAAGIGSSAQASGAALLAASSGSAAYGRAAGTRTLRLEVLWAAATWTLRLEVLWSTVSRREADRFLLTKGHIIERREKRIAQFETFRAAWRDEPQRKPVATEWELLWPI
ncbi:hypothetical protein JKP88DRAFT_302157 [Tribonema minus]|uniref:Calmodulin n=1 Tax=Tribonema minus TaxID=303371 RepID=A0A835ZF47_9STRA|nr:hypothetical protein JKP88DRAFT_302157 [Tribonema minus]